RWRRGAARGRGSRSASAASTAAILRRSCTAIGLVSTTSRARRSACPSRGWPRRKRRPAPARRGTARSAPTKKGQRSASGGVSMATADRSRVMRHAKAQVGSPSPDSDLQHGTLDVKLTRPARPNIQTPHAQDELYMVIRGRGVLFHDGKREPFESGDLLFVAAAVEHRFEDQSDDLLVWCIFYGPSGGDVPA